LGIQIVPNILVIEGQSYEDGKGISREEFYSRLPSMSSLPTTGTASAGAYTGLYERLLQEGAQHIVSIHPPTQLSGILNAASAAAQSFPGRVTVFDTRMLTLGMGFQVVEAAEVAAQGAGVEEVVACLEKVSPRARVLAMLDTLEYIRRSGRVSWARARLGDLLRIKPFIELRDGQVNSLGEVRTRSKGLARLRELLGALGPMRRLAILHTNAEAEARGFLESLAFPLPEPVLIVNVTTVIGAHVGPNGLGFAGIVR
jgi:DegV family protein with EDD domain